jgi:hypothetical protein
MGIHRKYPLFLSDLMKLHFSVQIFHKYSYIKFNENPSNGNRLASCVQTDMAKLTVALRNFANAPKNN